MINNKGRDCIIQNKRRIIKQRSKEMCLMKRHDAFNKHERLHINKEQPSMKRFGCKYRCVMLKVFICRIYSLGNMSL